MPENAVAHVLAGQFDRAVARHAQTHVAPTAPAQLDVSGPPPDGCVPVADEVLLDALRQQVADARRRISAALGGAAGF